MQPPAKRAILVDVIPPFEDKKRAIENLEELTRLVETYGGVVVVKIIQKRGRPSARTFVGTGKAEEIGGLAGRLKTDVVIVNNFLRANQAHHLEQIIPCEIWDRFELILKIFEKHARSEESKLQIELTRLKYNFPKLYGKGAALSQQAGQIGTKGPGEAILEYKKRYLRERIKRIEKKLKSIRQVQTGQRYRRRREGFKIVALVGYTNSGKTSLLKTLTRKPHLYIADKLFATLDTRLGHLYLEDQPEKILVADTIGFMQDLPPVLFESFLTTLEEVKESDLIIHLIDAADSKMVEKIGAVEKILEDLNCQNKPKIYVFNKIDLLPPDFNLEHLNNRFVEFTPIFVSATQEEGIEELKEQIKKSLVSNS